MKLFLKYMTVFVISSVLIPLIAVYFGQVFSSVREIFAVLI